MAGEAIGAGLPFHPPMMGWLAALLWRLADQPETVALAAKGLMAVVNAATYAGFYRLVRDRVPHAFATALVLPLGFGEMLLSASVNGESVYRLLLLALLALGRRLPIVAGLLHGAAALTRAEHLPAALAAGVAAAVLRPAWRRPVALAALGAAAVLVPYSAVTAGELAEYNRRHAEELAEPLPTIVPVSFYGPLNFALAQREPGIHFSRRTLPPAPGGLAELDPTFAPHQEVIVHGYRLGLEEIARRPLRFVRRSAAKAAHALRAVGFGWTWRDLPGGGPWVRQPVDLAHSRGWLYPLAAVLLALRGAWTLRERRGFLAVGGALLAYRLAVAVVFFPYLRGMLVVAPFWVALQVAGAVALVGRGPWGRRLLAALVAALGLYHLATAPLPRRYLLAGERDARGAIVDDRPVTLTYDGVDRERPGR